MSALQLGKALSDFKASLQNNADKIAETIEQREAVYRAPAPAIDIQNRLNALFDGYKHRAEQKIKQKLQPLTVGPDNQTLRGDLFTGSVRFEGTSIPIPDVDVLVYIFRDALNPQIEALAKMLEHSNSGLPIKEREKLIKELDGKINSLEQDQEQLYAHAKEAGLIVKEETVFKNIPKQQEVYQVKQKPVNEPQKILAGPKKTPGVYVAPPESESEKTVRELSKALNGPA